MGTPEYNSYYRSRRNSEISNKDYPYSVVSDYAPSTHTIQEENNGGYGRFRNPSSRYY